MLIPSSRLYCGIFDSNISRKGHSESVDRVVQCYELELFHNDLGISYINGEAHPTKRGMLICAKPGQVRHGKFPVKCSFIRFFTSKDSDGEIEKILSSLPDCIYINESADIDGLLALYSKLSACFIGQMDEIINQIRINGIFLEIVYRCMNICKGIGEQTSSHVNRIAREAYEYINENYTRDCSLKTIADAINISPNHLHTVFTQCIGMTPYECVLKKRIEKAQKLIMSGEKNMLEISMDTGFCSQSHFNKVFKAQTGETPANYRKKILEHY